MRRHLVLLGILALAAAPAAEALQWKVTATHNIRVIPRPEPQESRLTATGYHQTVITEISVEDTVFPIKFNIKAGKLKQSGQVQGTCSKDWTKASEKLSLLCMTSETLDPCQDGWWQASTLGRLALHPNGGTKQEVSTPTFATCECV